MNYDKMDELALKLTVDDHDVVWYLSGDGMPKSSDKDPDVFLKSNLWHGNKFIRVVGTTTNAALLHRLYEKRLNGGFDSLQVCSPLCCESAEERKDPEIVLYRMRSFNVSPSLGGWHEFGLADFTSYLLAEHFTNQDEATDFSRGALVNHVAWPALSFIETLNADEASRLLSQLIDPRWYVDAINDPNRGSRLEQFLNLNPRGQAETADSKGDWRENKYKLVLSCWKNSQPEKITVAGPRNFLWRAWASKGGGDKGDLTASKLFISYLRLTWTQSVCRGPQASRLFVPKYFFQQEDEIKAYETWRQSQAAKA